MFSEKDKGIFKGDMDIFRDVDVSDKDIDTVSAGGDIYVLRGDSIGVFRNHTTIVLSP